MNGPVVPVHLAGLATGQSRRSYLLGILLTIAALVVLGLPVFLFMRTVPDVPVMQSFALLAINAMAIPALALVAHFVHGMRLGDLVAPGRPADWGMLGRSALVWAVPLLAQVAIGLWNGELQPTGTAALVFLTLAPVSVLLFTLQASAEELLFRGYLAQGAQLLFRHALPAALLTGLLFTLAHEGSGARAVWGQRAEIMAMALFLSWITTRFGRLEAAMGVHIINNVLFSIFIGGADFSFPDLLTRVDSDPPDLDGLADWGEFALHQALTIGFYWLAGIRTGFVERGLDLFSVDRKQV
ncbi:CPBP family intramembrane glutamic endopeptidase [Niveispirillum sp. KHB5.9]|uniref:CPBP family intramembrane glutamic endopeptidase n=1 Tax=Niveispirillum sp. KHB5.9 TaxID=3400269 RepID=UPI003A86FC64